jgi:hypothetical protein
MEANLQDGELDHQSYAQGRFLRFYVVALTKKIANRANLHEKNDYPYWAL